MGSGSSPELEPVHLGKGGPGELPPGVLPQPTMTRAEIAAGDHFIVRGAFDSQCDGAVRVDLLTGSLGFPIAVLQLTDGESEFEVLAPTGNDEMMITAICDIDRDGRLSPNDWLSDLVPLGSATEDRSDLLLHWMPNMDPGSMALGAPEPRSEVPSPTLEPPEPVPQ